MLTACRPALLVSFVAAFHDVSLRRAMLTLADATTASEADRLAVGNLGDNPGGIAMKVAAMPVKYAGDKLASAVEIRCCVGPSCVDRISA